MWRVVWARLATQFIFEWIIVEPVETAIMCFLGIHEQKQLMNQGVEGGEGGEYKVVAQATVRAGMSTTAKQTRTLPPGQIVTVLEIGQSEGHQRARISENEWVSISTAQGSVLLVPVEPSPSVEDVVMTVNPVSTE